MCHINSTPFIWTLNFTHSVWFGQINNEEPKKSIY
jgi:hypothetical protein